MWDFKDILGCFVLIGGLGIASNMSLVKEKPSEPKTSTKTDSSKPKSQRQPQNVLTIVPKVFLPTTHQIQLQGSSLPEEEPKPLPEPQMEISSSTTDLSLPKNALTKNRQTQKISKVPN